MRTCEFCGRSFEAQRARFCSSTCRARKSEGVAPPSTVPPPEADPGRPVSGLVDSVRAELEKLKKLDSVSGQHALELASRIASAPGMNTGVAALSKELSRVLGEARQGSTAVVNPLDELKARRDFKRAAAS